MHHPIDAHIGTDDWHEDIVAVLAALPHGTWTTGSDLTALVDQPAETITAFVDATCPAGHERVLSITGCFRPGTAYAGLSRPERTGQLERVGIRLSAQGRADRAQRLEVRALAAVLADPATGVLPDGTIREWPSRAGACNTEPADRERLLALAGTCRWRDIDTNWDLVRRSGLPQALEYTLGRLFAAVTMPAGTPTWPTRALTEAGLVGPDQTADYTAVHVIGLRALEAHSVVEVYSLIGPAQAAPVLILTRPMPAAAEAAGHTTPCHRGRHGQCRGFYDRNRDWSWCPCGCGCTANQRATTVRYLVRGDDFAMPHIRRGIALSDPTPVEPDRVRVRTRDWFNSAVSEINYGQDWIAFVHNPRRRAKPAA
ncbi:hypothetical protein [Glycomyces tenuis]|nr:hypothetical protein [Glycomyces tenuis]